MSDAILADRVTALLYRQLIDLMDQAASDHLATAAVYDKRAAAAQEALDRDTAEAAFLRDMAGRWARVTTGVEQGVITLDDVSVSLEFAEGQLAARTLEAAGVESWEQL